MTSVSQYPITLSLTEPVWHLKCAGFLTDQQIAVMEGLRTFPAPIKLKTKKTKSLSDTQKYKKNCVEEFEEPVCPHWSQVEAPYGGVYASGSVLTKKFRADHEGENLPKRHFFTLESAVEFAERLECCEAITKTTAGYELRMVRCGIKNTESGFNGGLRVWLRTKPFDDFEGKTYDSLDHTEDAHILVPDPTEAKKIQKHNTQAYEEQREMGEEEVEVVDSEDEREMGSTQEMEGECGVVEWAEVDVNRVEEEEDTDDDEPWNEREEDMVDATHHWDLFAEIKSDFAKKLKLNFLARQKEIKKAKKAEKAKAMEAELEVEVKKFSKTIDKFQTSPTAENKAELIKQQKKTDALEVELVEAKSVEYKWEFFKELNTYGVKLSEDEKKYMDKKMGMGENENTGELCETYEEISYIVDLDEDTMEAVAGWFEGTEAKDGFIRKIDMEEAKVELVKIE